LSKKIKDIEKQDHSTTGISIPVENGLKLSKPLSACNGLKKGRVLFPLFMVSVQNKIIYVHLSLAMFATYCLKIEFKQVHRYGDIKTLFI
jgi:hypothetical protein